MRKAWIIAAILLTTSALTLAVVLRFTQKPADSEPIAPSQPSEEPQQKLAECDRLHSEAITRQAEGRYAEALALHGKSLAIQRAALGNRHEDVVATLRRMAELHALLDDFDKARQAAQEALDIQSQLPAAKRWQITDARQTLHWVEEVSQMDAARRHKVAECGRLHDQMLSLYLKGKYRDGIKLAQQIREMSAQTFAERHRQRATSMNNLGVFHHALGDYSRAGPVYREALDIFKDVLGEEHPDYVITFNNLAVLHGLKGDYQKALPLYRRARDLRRQAVGEKHPDYVRSINNLAWLHKAMGDYANAEPLYLQALHLHEQGLRYGHPNSRILEIYRQVDLRRPPSAAEMQSDLALIVGNLAVCYHEMGDYARAEPLYRRTLDLIKKTLGEKNAVFARHLNNLATVYQLMGDYTQAETLFQRAVDLRKATLGDKHPDYAASLHNLGRFYHICGDYDRAEPLYLQALAIRKQKLGEKHPYYAQTLDKLAWLYHLKGDHVRAEPLYLQALEARKSALGERHRYDATIVTNQALLYQAMGQYGKAESLFRKSLEWTKKEVGEQNPEYARTLHHLAMLQLAQQKYADAERLARPPVNISRTLLERCAGVQSERQQLAMVQTSRFYLDGYLSIAVQAGVPTEDIYAEVLAWKGAVLQRQQFMRLQRSHPELTTAFAELNRVSGRLAALALAVPDPRQAAAFRRQVEELTEEKERLERELAGRSSAFREDRDAARLPPSRLRAALPEDVALIDFLEYERRTPPPRPGGRWNLQRHLTAFLIRANSIQQFDLGPVPRLAEAIDRWRASYGAGKVPADGSANPAAELRRHLWEPLEPHLKGIKVVLVSPDGPLHGLPLAALPDARGDSFLVRDHAFATVPVPQLLCRRLRDSPPPAGEPPSLLLAGGIDFGEGKAAAVEDGARALPSRPLFRPLPGTESEVNDLCIRFQKTFPRAAPPKVLSESDASKQAVLTAAPSHRFVHLATHGFFAAASEPAVLVAENRDGLLPDTTRLRTEAAARNPGLLSGVVFAGVNRPDRRPEDTILTALEAGELDLSKVELVVLSACDTGRGQVAGGEGVLGLQRAFQLAGARSVVASLWSVPDEETHQLMREFYRRVWSDKSVAKAEALRQAQLWMLENWKPRGGLVRQGPKGPPPPYVWAAFVLSGDWR